MKIFSENLNFLCAQTAFMARVEFNLPDAVAHRIAIRISRLISVEAEHNGKNGKSNQKPADGGKYNSDAQTPAATTSPASGQISGHSVAVWTASELSSAFGVPVSTLSAWRATDGGPPFRRRGYRKIFYPVIAAEAWMKLNGYTSQEGSKNV